jgi:hypothetical protein
MLLSYRRTRVFSIRNPHSQIRNRLVFSIRNPHSQIRNRLVFSIRNPQSQIRIRLVFSIRNPQSAIPNPHSADPKEAVEVGQQWSGTFPFQRSNLLAQSEILQGQLHPTGRQGLHEGKHHLHELEHDSWGHGCSSQDSEGKVVGTAALSSVPAPFFLV